MPQGQFALLKENPEIADAKDFGKALVGDTLAELKLERGAKGFAKLTGDPFAAEAYKMAKGDTEKARGLLAYGSLVRKQRVDKGNVSKDSAKNFLQQVYAQEHGANLSEEQQRFLDQKLNDEKTINQARQHLADQQSLQNVENLNERFLVKGRSGADAVRGKEVFAAAQSASLKTSNEIIEKARKARERLATTIPNLKDIIYSGKLPSAESYLTGKAFLNEDLTKAILTNDEYGAFEATLKDFLGDLRPTFGGRITNTELLTFLKSLPGLGNTPGARKLILANIEQINKMAVVENNIRRRIVDKYRRENNTITYPNDLNDLILKEMEESPEVQKVYQEYSNTVGYMRALSSLKSGGKVDPQTSQKFHTFMHGYLKDVGYKQRTTFNDPDAGGRSDYSVLSDAFKALEKNPDLLPPGKRIPVVLGSGVKLYAKKQDGKLVLFKKKENKDANK